MKTAKPILYFIHIPKTGGRTLDSIFRSYFFKNQTLVDYEGLGFEGVEHRTRMYYGEKYFAERWSRLPEAERRRVRYVTAHMGFGWHRYADRPYVYVTMLRHPVERFLSQYFFLKRWTEHALYPAISSGSMTIGDFLESPHSDDFHNGQSRLLAGDPSPADHPDHPPTAAELGDPFERALANVRDHRICVGLTEYFDESLLFIQRDIGLRGTPFYVVRNRTENRPLSQDFPEALIRRIEERNRHDLRLFAHFHLGMRRRIEEAGPAFGSKVAAFRRMNRAYNFRVMGQGFCRVYNSARNAALQLTGGSF